MHSYELRREDGKAMGYKYWEINCGNMDAVNERPHKPAMVVGVDQNTTLN